jgi:peptidyl-Lys metalloendopeptidase
MADEEWFEVCRGTTNDTPNSCVSVRVDTTPICPNMTNADFRKMARSLIALARNLVERRLSDLDRNDAKTKERMKYWFGRDDEGTRTYLKTGFESVRRVLSDLKPEHLIRRDSEEDRAIGCAPGIGDLEHESAHVCGPNITHRRIAISMQFCTTLTDYRMFSDSRVSTLIHEITHFVDTFASKDPMYAISTPLALWGQRNSELAVANADSLAAYVIYNEKSD